MKRVALAKDGVRSLCRGDVVCRRGSDISWIVDREATETRPAIGIRTIEVTADDEWDLVEFTGQAEDLLGKGRPMKCVTLGRGAMRSWTMTKRHKWIRVSRVSDGHYEATHEANLRRTLYPAKCDDCGALISMANRPSKRDVGRTVEVEVFSTDGGDAWTEERPACAVETRDRATRSEAARDRRRP